MAATTPTTPGIQTTEFWITLLKLVLTSATALIALFHPGFSVPQQVQDVIMGSAPLAAAITVGIYTYSRTKLKTSAIAAVVATLEKDLEDAKAAAAANSQANFAYSYPAVAPWSATTASGTATATWTFGGNNPEGGTAAHVVTPAPKPAVPAVPAVPKVPQVPKV